MNNIVYDRKSIARRILKIIRDERAFHDINLSREIISDYINVPRNIISEVVKNEMNTSLTDLINKYRVRYAKSLLESKKHKDKTIDDIALMSGFSCRMSLYRAYKKEYKQTPGDTRHNKEI